MSALSISSTSASTCPLIYEEPTSYIELFLLHNPECREQVETDELLKKTLEEACLEPKKCKERGYQALCAYFDKPAPSTDRIVFDNGMTLVHFAALGGQESCLAGEDLGDVNGSFVAHYLAMGGRETLLDRIEQVKLFVLDETGLSPLDYAFMYKRKEVVEWFASRGSSQLACLMRDVFLSPYVADEFLYTGVGVRIVKLLATLSCYPKLQKAKDISLVVHVLFLSIFYFFYQWFNADSFEKIAELTKQSYQKLEAEDKTLWESLNTRAEKEVLDRLNSIGIEGIDSSELDSSEEDCKIIISYVLDRIFGVRNFRFFKYSLSMNGKGERIKLGEGGFSRVYKLYDKKGESYALKACKNRIDPLDRREREWYNYLKITDPDYEKHFVKIEDFVFLNNRPALVMELYSGNLNEFIKKNKNDSYYLNHTHNIAVQILDALVYLRKQGVVHADIKLQNILVKNPFWCVVIGDFSLACRNGTFPEEIAPPNNLQTCTDRSPECFLHALQYYGCEMDMWSFGCVLFELFTTTKPFSCIDTKINEQYTKIVSQQQTYLGPYSEVLLGAATSERRGWHAALPSQKGQPNLSRVVANAVPKKGWIKGERIGYLKSEKNFSLFLDLLERVLQLCPWDRATPQEALEHPFFSSLKEKG